MKRFALFVAIAAALITPSVGGATYTDENGSAWPEYRPTCNWQYNNRGWGWFNRSINNVVDDHCQVSNGQTLGSWVRVWTGAGMYGPGLH